MTNEFELQPIRNWELEDIGPAGTAPENQDEFDQLVASRQLVAVAGLGGPVVFGSSRRFSQGSGGGQRTGTHTYTNTGRGRGTVVLTYDRGGDCTLRLVFDSDASGSMDYTCVGASNNESTGSTDWRLEYAGPGGLAPADQGAFDARFVGKRVTVGLAGYWIDFTSPGRFTENEFGTFYNGTYTYENTGANSGTLDFRYEDGDWCTFDVAFATTTSGSADVTCRDDGMRSVNWQAVNRP